MIPVSPCIHIQILKNNFHIQKRIGFKEFLKRSNHFSLVVALQIHMPFLLIMYRRCLEENLVFFTSSQGLNRH